MSAGGDLDHNADQSHRHRWRLKPKQKSSWTTFIKQIASFGGDLSSLTAPPFILSPVSLTEFPAYWGERPELFSSIAEGVDEEDRSVRVLKWFIATLKGQYTSRNEKMGSEKKPLNPVLGELFFGEWPETETRGKTTLTVEQVSHHPPVTAYRMYNAKSGVELSGFSGQKTSFSGGSIIVKQTGHAVLTLHGLPSGKEQYLITLPRLRIDGLWYGSPYTELSDMSYIQCENGWLSTIEYKGKGYFSGKPHSFKAVLTPPYNHPAPDEHTHVVEGTWHETSSYTKASGFQPELKPGLGTPYFTDVRGPKEEISVKPESEQGEWESRKLWKMVAEGIRSGDYDLASKEKTKIENQQRQMRKDEVAAGTTWQLKYFKKIPHDELYERLSEMYNGQPPTDEMYVYTGPDQVQD
ncbi:Oxysterol-binding protein [Calocera viscosa TUFC12733]|uniref:Oxysterol-binding protein n=1 Tax=Calocera viscosa (strain TUFC12733) TaxID=1330018 RepID=A0A167NEG4_CALVF|nr:Oxysterol-binding protein [Calocera viscosa TUFC12733]